MPQYVRFVRSHPLFAASLLGRHLFNGLDVAYPTPYVARVVPRSVWFASLNYAILAMALALLVARWRDALSTPHTRWRLSAVAVYLLPTLLAVPTAIENRFFLPLWLLAVGAVVLGRLPLSHEEAPGHLARRILVFAVVGIALGVVLASATYGRILGAPETYQTWCLLCRP